MGGFFDRAENLLLPLIDRIYARMPRPNPGIERLTGCRIISHRGEHDGRRVFENTLAAFDAAVEQGVWGIEFDVRWTRDLEPVVTHDPDLRRVFGQRWPIGDSSLNELRRLCPHVPTLAEVIGRYGGRVHLMVEIKEEPYADPGRQNRILGDLFAGLCPGRDFHLLALTPGTFRLTPFAPPSAFLPVARVNISEASRIALQRGYAGIAGHYAMLGAEVIERHHAAGQQVGTGYIRSRNALLREINRGVDWIFSNHAGEVQALVQKLQSADSRRACSRPFSSSTK
jgi:glycerophosphoryl diester phosphodiesterase